MTLKSGQIFALISYNGLPGLMGGNASIIDCWQAHSDGDLLEIYAAESASQVLGFSNSDPGSDVDPVPYLDREENVVNGLINGREKLMPGERLVWLPAPEDAEDEKSVIFESREHCQIVSRTWSPILAPHGFPLLLNDFTHTDMWPAASRSVNEALALPAPRVWAPRQDRDPGWESIGVAPPKPDYWLPQLKRRHQKR